MNAMMDQEDPYSELRSLTERVRCPQCVRKRMYYCYNCIMHLPQVSHLVPKVSLPAKIHIIKHPKEHVSKSTALHCALLAPEDTVLYDSKTEELPDFNDRVKFPNTVLVYPGKNATSIVDYVKENGPIQNFIFLDATWFQVKGIRRRSELDNVPTVILKTYKTEYWRPQKGFSDEFLATIEAIRYALKENAEASGENINDDYLKDLLFWFYFFRSKVDTGILENR